MLSKCRTSENYKSEASLIIMGRFDILSPFLTHCACSIDVWILQTQIHLKKINTPQKVFKSITVSVEKYINEVSTSENYNQWSFIDYLPFLWWDLSLVAWSSTSRSFFPSFFPSLPWWDYPRYLEICFLFFLFFFPSLPLVRLS